VTKSVTKYVTKGTQIMKVGDVICVTDFHDLCRKVSIMEFVLNQTDLD